MATDTNTAQSGGKIGVILGGQMVVEWHPRPVAPKHPPINLLLADGRCVATWHPGSEAPVSTD